MAKYGITQTNHSRTSLSLICNGEIRRFRVDQLDFGDRLGDVRGPEVPDVAHDREDGLGVLAVVRRREAGRGH